MNFKDIPRITRPANYRVDVPLRYLEDHVNKAMAEVPALDVNPDFQRPVVWSEERMSKYVEYLLRGGTSGREFSLNCVGWMRGFSGPYVLVDGKQRLTALMRFLNDQLPVFGHRLSEFKGSLPWQASISWNVNDLATEWEVLQWYLAMNEGHVAHTPDELVRVRTLLSERTKR